MISQGEVWWADLEEPIGSAPGYRRPVVIVHSDAFNRSELSTVICVAMTSNLKLAAMPGNVRLAARSTGLERDSVANVSAVVTLDKTQLTECVGRLTKKQMNQLFFGLDLVFGR